MTVEVIHYTSDQLNAKRAELLQRIGDRAELLEHAEMHMMTPDERDLLHDLEEVEFLLEGAE
jgi:hypothetical protein